MSAKYTCQVCGSGTDRRTTAAHDMGSSLRAASPSRGIGAQEWCRECRHTVQTMPMHRGCELGGPRRDSSHVACAGCGRDLDSDEQRRIEDCVEGERACQKA